MTLIISAFCKDGLCVGYDTGRKMRDGSWRDDAKKVFSFSDIPLLTCHHGIDEIKGCRWDKKCEEYKQSSKWKGLKFEEMVKNFFDFINQDVMEQMKYESDGVFGLLLCGAVKKGVPFTAWELFWEKNKVGQIIPPEKLPLPLILSGDGKDYLPEYKNPQYLPRLLFKNKSVDEGRVEITNLFAIAIKRQDEMKKFSPQYDFEPPLRM